MNKKDSQLFDVVKQNDAIAVKEFIKKGADVNARDEEGLTPLMTASSKNYKNLAEILISEGADVSTRDTQGFTALIWAASENRKEIAELLISNGADVNAKDDMGGTPLSWAGSKDMADFLKSQGAKE